MKANNSIKSNDQKECSICKKMFFPNPKVKNQRVCRDYICQKIRQIINHYEWQKKEKINYKNFYQHYYKPWLEKNPDYHKKYRKRKKAKQAVLQKKVSAIREILEPLLDAYIVQKKNKLSIPENENSGKTALNKKEELTSLKTDSYNKDKYHKKEELTYCFYLIKANELEIIQLLLPENNCDNLINKLNLCT